MLSIINLVILYLQINIVVIVPAPICYAKHPVQRLFFIQKRQLLFRNPSKGFQHPQNMKIKIPHERNCCIWPDIPFSKIKWIFTWLFPLPFAKYYSPHQIASKKGDCELKYIKNASGILGKQKLQILHEKTYVNLQITYAPWSHVFTFVDMFTYCLVMDTQVLLSSPIPSSTFL